jgi:hypothetical protein
VEGVEPRGIALAALIVCLVAASAAGAAATSDRGSDRPPARLDDDAKALWMTEWTACWRVSLARMSKILHTPVTSGTTPQQAARRLSKRAVRFLYETKPELATAADGCRNGVLWRYYHPPA